jgi:hypothetical protein
MITSQNSGASELACNIINNTFLSLDGFESLRKQMNSSEYTSEHFAAELARIVDREINHYTNEKIKNKLEFLAKTYNIDTTLLFASNKELVS